MPPSLLVFSDLDGTLLDGTSYSFEAALPALGALRQHGIPLVLCSSKTRSEMEPLAARLGCDGPLVVENGGAVVIPPTDDDATPARLVPLGLPRAQLVAALPELARATGLELRSFSAMSHDEIATLTGLSREDSARAQQRDFDEPFLVIGSDGCPRGRDPALDRRLAAAARRMGLRVVHGGRLHHLGGLSDKGVAVRLVLRLPRYRRASSVGLGDAASDLPMLQAVGRAILMPGPTGVDRALAAALPGAERAPAAGPGGWNAAVLTVVEGGLLPRKATRPRGLA
jgi:mannosyl-3-phosphoglycerate phosphatase family protein